jgi:hypothetical protein
MKHGIKLITGIFFLPLLAIAGIIAIVKTIVVITVVFAWQTGHEWHGEMLTKLHKFMQWMK